MPIVPGLAGGCFTICVSPPEPIINTCLEFQESHENEPCEEATNCNQNTRWVVSAGYEGTAAVVEGWMTCNGSYVGGCTTPPNPCRSQFIQGRDAWIDCFYDIVEGDEESVSAWALCRDPPLLKAYAARAVNATTRGPLVELAREPTGVLAPVDGLP